MNTSEDQPSDSSSMAPQASPSRGLSRRTIFQAAGAGAAILCVPASGVAAGAPLPFGSRMAMLAQDGGGTLLASIPFDLWSIYNPLLGQADPLIFDRLFRFDANLVPTPSLATSLEISEDGLTYTITLVENAKWHDGTPLTAADVVFTIETVLDPAINFPYKFALQVNGENIVAEAVDDYTVVLTLPAPNAALQSHLTAPWILSIAPKHLLEGEDQETTPYNLNPVGSGPFRFVEQVDGDHQTVARVDDYFEGAPLLTEVITRPITDLQARLAAFQAGEVDVDTREEDLISTNQFGAVEGSTAYVLETPYVQQLMLNNADPILGDLSVRQAIAHALDRPAMVRVVVGDEAYAALSVMGPGHWAYNANVPTYEYDVEKAKSLLDAAGWVEGDGGIREKEGVRLAFLNQPWRDFERNYAPLIQQYLLAVGIEMTIETVADYATVEEIRRSGTAQCLFYGSIDYEPGELHQYFHSSQVAPAGLNLWNYANPDVDALLEEGLVITDLEARTAIYGTVQETLLAECVTIPLHVHLNNVIVRTDRVSGYPEPAGNWMGVIAQAPWLVQKQD